MDLVLIRHAESQFNVKKTGDLNSPLSERGQKQAIEVAEFLKRKFEDIEQWTGLVSPFQRTLHTAKTIADYTGVKFQVDFRLAEYAHYSSGYKNSEPIKIHLARQKFPFFAREEDVWIQKPDSEQSFLDRLTDFLSSLNNRRYVVVSHAMPIYCMIHILQGNPIIPQWDKKILNTSVTWFKDDELKYFARFVNSGTDPRPGYPEPIMLI